MKNAIILHGCPEKENYYDASLPSESNAHWLPWLQHELIIHDIAAATPEVPHSYEPRWEVWCREVERFDIGPQTILVGHSAGGGFWVKYLSLHPELHVRKVVLVAPWLDPDQTLADKTFFAFDIDVKLRQRVEEVVIFVADDDSPTTLQSVGRLIAALPGVTVRRFPAGYGHFTYENLGGVQFPELRDEVLGA